MKSPNSLACSARARVQQARNRAELINQRIARYDGRDALKMSTSDIAKMREDAEALLQCVHEFSAYWTTLHTY